MTNECKNSQVNQKLELPLDLCRITEVCRACEDFNPKYSGWEIINEDESKDGDQHSSLANLDSSPGTSGHKMGHGSSGERVSV